MTQKTPPAARQTNLLLFVLAASTLWPISFGSGALSAQEPTEQEEDPGITVAGTVVDFATDAPLSGATVSLGSRAGVRGRGTRVTDDGGRFSFSGVPEGTYRLVVRSEGFREMRDTLPVPAGRDLELLLPLATATTLEPVIVSGRLSDPVPGYERRRRGGGARFLITREDILERQPRHISELLHRVPGGIVVPTPPEGYTLRLRGQCLPGIWVDAVPWPGATSVDRVVTPQEVEALEVYHGFELPVEFGVNSCGGILIWTRRGTPATGDDEEGGGPMSFLGRLVTVAAAILVVVVMTR